MLEPDFLSDPWQLIENCLDNLFWQIMELGFDPFESLVTLAAPFIDFAAPSVKLEFMLVALALKHEPLLVVPGNLLDEGCLIVNQQRHRFLKMIVCGVTLSNCHASEFLIPGKLNYAKT